MLKNLAIWSARLLAGFFAICAIATFAGVLQARIVLTDSMKPNLQVNDLVFGASWLEPGIGQVALYQQRDVEGVVRQDVVHRIIAQTAEGTFEFKGDANTSADALLVERGDIKGVIFLKIPAVGSFFSIGGGIAVALCIFGIWALAFGISRFMSGKQTDATQN